MKNKFLSLILFVTAIAIIVPSVALAAWWNPFSWHIWNNIWNFIFHGQAQIEVQQQSTQSAYIDFSKLNKDELLHKLFPSVNFSNGVGDLSQNEFYNTTNLYLKKSVEDYFINKNEKNLLLIAQLDGVAHAGGLYHAFLGLFDIQGNILTPVSTLSGSRSYDLFSDKAQFGGDGGQFGFYNCNGIKYILFVSSGCPNSTCCSDAANLYRVNNGNFEKIQTIDDKLLAKAKDSFFNFVQTANAATGSYYGLKMILFGNDILVKKVPFSSDNGCSETDYKKLSWDDKTCKFIENKTGQTADWKTYTNNQFGFSFQYPKNWVVEPIVGDNMVNVWSSTDKMQSSKGAIIPIYPEFSVKYWDTDSFKDFASGLGLRNVNNAKDFVAANFQKYIETTVVGKKAYVAISVANRAVYTAYVDFNGVYVLSAGLADESKQDPQNPGLDQNIKNIISTFKFTTPAVSSATSSWKTYTNNNLGISINYPSSWTYQEYSCNIDGVAFCPIKTGISGCGQTCSMNSPGSPIYFVIDMWNNSKDKQKSLLLSDKNYQDIYNQMLSSFDSTIAWKTYSGYGISFKYPPSMGTPAVNQLSTKTEIGWGHMAESFSIGVYYDQNLGRNKTFSEVVNDAKNNQNVWALSQENITVGGITGVKLTYTDKTTGGGTTEIYVPSGDAQGDILMAYEYGRGVTAEGLTVSIEQILPTLKFTK